jgi:hypothetical protein
MASLLMGAARLGMAGLTTHGLALVSMRFGTAARHAHGHATALGLDRWRGRELRLHRFARSGLCYSLPWPQPNGQPSETFADPRQPLDQILTPKQK